MRAKLGLFDEQPADMVLIESVFQLLAKDRVDYTIFWRRLSHWVAGRANADAPRNDDPVRDLFLDRAAIDAWLLQYLERLTNTGYGPAGDLMLKTNPKFVLRNHLGEQAIRLAKLKDFSGVHTLQRLLETPFDEHPGFDSYADFPPDWASTIEISCSS